MFWSTPKLPISDEDRLWVEGGFRRLEQMLGRNRMLECAAVVPTDNYFPEPYERSETGLRTLCGRVCGFMGVEASRVHLQVIGDSTELMEMLPEHRYSRTDPAGLYFGTDKSERSFIAVRQSLAKDPMSAVARIAHELGHVILLGRHAMNRDLEDMNQ